MLTPVKTALYARADSDAITVWAPRLHAGAELGDSTKLDAVYAVDVWTGASIDVVTAATEAIHEVRHEIVPSISHELSHVTLSGSYRYSTENDYWSHGGVVGIDVDMASNNTTLSLAVLGSQDIVGRSGDPGFRRPQESLGGRVALTQVLSKKSLAQISWDTVRLTGYLASPYRYVALGGDGLCSREIAVGADLPTRAAPADPGALCLPEAHPHERIRNAVTGKMRFALGEVASLGLNYRFYFDDWGILSHTIWPDLAFVLGEHATLRLMYRYYVQGEADFYQARYLNVEAPPRYLSRDRKMSPLYNNRVGLEYLHDFELGASGDTVFTLAMRAGLTRFYYHAFVGLTEVDVLELTGLLGMTFR